MDIMKSKNKRKGRYCSVPQCRNSDSSGSISLHCFPKDATLREKWTLQLEYLKPTTKFMKVCSEHFEEKDYTRLDVSGVTQRPWSRELWRSSTVCVIKREKSTMCEHILINITDEIKCAGTGKNCRQRKRLKRFAVPSKKLPIHRHDAAVIQQKSTPFFKSQKQTIRNVSISPTKTGHNENMQIVNLEPENDSAVCTISAHTKSFVEKCVIRIDLLAAQFFMPKFARNI